MHELSIALNILDIASEESVSRGGAGIVVIYARVGELSGVVRDALVSAFELAREQSPFPACRLVVEELPVRVSCRTCRSDQPVKSLQDLSCSVCGTPSSCVVGGTELEIVAMEIEEPGERLESIATCEDLPDDEEACG